MEESSFRYLFDRWMRRIHLSDDDRRAIIELPWTHRTAGRDAYLLREGEPTTTCMLLLNGFAFRQKLMSDGKRQIMNLAKEVKDASDRALEQIGNRVLRFKPFQICR